MLIKCEESLSKAMVISILERFDMSFEDPLHNIIDIMMYGEKLSLHAHFILAYDDNKLVGFIAYYINKEGRYAYIPFIAVHSDGRHRRVGHMMLSYLWNIIPVDIDQVRLEVKVSNVNAQDFYHREGFYVISDENNGKLLLNKDLINK